jgi:hypothetical protein
MNRLRREIIDPLRRAFRAAQEELHLLEQDLGLCAQCGSRPPVPLKERAKVRSRLHRVTAASGRRVA